MTARIQQAEKQQYFDAGVVAVIEKPFEATQLGDELAAIYQRYLLTLKSTNLEKSMQVPARLLTEHERLPALQLTGLLDTESEPRFDRITHLARLVLCSEIVLMSLVDSERQWFKSKQGLDACETGRDISFCGHAILGHGIFEVPDTLLDSRFVDNLLVTQAPFICFYASVSLSRSGEQIGTLCFIDSKPRTLTANEREIATEFTKTVEQEIEDRLQAQPRQQLAASELTCRTRAQGFHQNLPRKFSTIFTSRCQQCQKGRWHRFGLAAL
ncbi:MAG: GAF domain-containing protein [Alishewanella sp.]|nr:GAF domain-containing protein [Alishewanella sp.]